MKKLIIFDRARENKDDSRLDRLFADNKLDRAGARSEAQLPTLYDYPTLHPLPNILHLR